MPIYILFAAVQAAVQEAQRLQHQTKQGMKIRVQVRQVIYLTMKLVRWLQGGQCTTLGVVKGIKGNEIKSNNVHASCH